MLEFFDQILGFFELAWEFLLNVIKSLGSAILFVSQISPLPLSLIGFMPTVLGTCITIVVGMAVIKFIVGR